MNSHPPLSEQDLDEVFAQVRHSTAADLGAADRFLKRTTWMHPELSATHAPAPRVRRPNWWLPALAAAALAGGIMMLRPPITSHPAGGDLPSSAAYEAYGSAIGGEW
ncbi:MAG: hypothetical protein ACR2J4_02040 [Deinococcus sp.]